ncbi:hypothetical protein FPOAC2_06682 [Fusarium poae]|jgi:hypothetical protein
MPLLDSSKQDKRTQCFEPTYEEQRRQCIDKMDMSVEQCITGLRQDALSTDASQRPWLALARGFSRPSLHIVLVRLWKSELCAQINGANGFDHETKMKWKSPTKTTLF